MKGETRGEGWGRRRRYGAERQRGARRGAGGRSLALALACLVAAACEGGCSRGDGLDEIPAYVAPTPHAPGADPRCEGLARADASSRWGDEGAGVEIAQGGALVISDASTLGGPFSPPLRIDLAPGRYATRVLRGETALGAARPLCVALKVAEGAAVTWRDEGAVVVDTDVVLIADGPHFMSATAPALKRTFAVVEADAADLTRVASDARAHGLELATVLPTIGRARRPLAEGDVALLNASVARVHVVGRVGVEPASTASDIVETLGERDVAEFRAGPGPGETALAVESPAGAGAYVVASGFDAGGARVVVELRLAP